MSKSAILEIPEAEARRLEELLDQTLDALRSLEETEARRQERCAQLAAESDAIFKENEARLAYVGQILKLPLQSFLPD
jgi:hypothetical protein